MSRHTSLLLLVVALASGCPAPQDTAAPVGLSSGVDAVMFVGGPVTGYVGGAPLSFTSGVVNAEALDGGAVTVDGAVTTGLLITAASGVGWTCTVGTGGGSFTCDHAAPLAGGASLPAIAVETSAVGPHGNATLCATASVAFDNNAGNDEDCHSVELLMPTSSYDVRVEKGPSTDTLLSPGAPGIYRIDIFNDGPDPVPDPVTFTDTIPAGMSVDFVSTPITGEWSCTTAGQTVTCTRVPGMLLYEQNSVFIYVTLSPELKGEIENCVTVSAPQDQNASNDTACHTADLPVPAPFDLSVQKIDWAPYVAGATGASWQIVIENHGPNAATGAIVIEDVLPPGVTVNSWGGTSLFLCTPGTGGGSISCTATTAIPVGASQQLFLSATVPAGTPAPLVNCAKLSAAGDLDPTNNESCTNSQGNSDVSISKTLVGSLTFGGTATYQVSVQNNGPMPVPWSPIVNDGLPPGSVLTSVSAGSNWNCNSSGSYLNCGYTGSLPVALGSLGTITYTITIADAEYYTDGYVENCAKVEPVFPDGTPDDNTSCVRVDVPVEPIDIAVGVEVRGGTRPNGRTVAVIDLSNDGAASVDLPAVEVPLPPNTRYLGARVPSQAWDLEVDVDSVRFTPLGAMPPGETLSIEIDLLLDEAAPIGAPLQVCADVTAEDGTLLESGCGAATIQASADCAGHTVSPELFLYDDELALAPAPAGTIIETFLRDRDGALLPAGTQVRVGDSFEQSTMLRVSSVGTSTQYAGGAPVLGQKSASVQWTSDGVDAAYIASFLGDDARVGIDAIAVTPATPAQGLLVGVEGATDALMLKVYDPSGALVEVFEAPSSATRVGVAALCGTAIGRLEVVPGPQTTELRVTRIAHQ